MSKTISENEIFNASEQELTVLMERARKISWNALGKRIRFYYPSKEFPSVSITGSACAQSCLYCNKHYLKAMHSLTTPQKMLNFALKLKAKGGKGMLISGGYDEESVVPINSYLDTISQIKKKTNLFINIHPGLVTLEQAKAIYDAGVDAASFDLVTDNHVIREVIRNGKTAVDYKKSFEALINAKLKVVPHICLGLYYGTEKGNIEAVKLALNYDIPLIVFLGFIPTKGTPMEKSKVITSDFLAKISIYTRFRKTDLEQSLGCMRVRLPEYEREALLVGMNRIAVPKKKTIEFAKKTLGLNVESVQTCCAI